MVVEEIHASNHAHTQYSVKAGFPWLAVHTSLLTMWNTSKNTHTHTHITHTHLQLRMMHILGNIPPFSSPSPLFLQPLPSPLFLQSLPSPPPASPCPVCPLISPLRATGSNTPTCLSAYLKCCLLCGLVTDTRDSTIKSPAWGGEERSRMDSEHIQSHFLNNSMQSFIPITAL